MEAKARADKILAVAHENGWTGTVQDDGQFIQLSIFRNDETLGIEWADNDFHVAHYYIFDRLLTLDLKESGEVIKGWPDLIKLFKWFPKLKGPSLTETYRRLPFADDADNEEILTKLVGRPVFWYDHTEAKIRTDVVMPAKGTKKNQYRIVDIGHRKLLHFNGARDGFKSLMIDAILKVG